MNDVLWGILILAVVLIGIINLSDWGKIWFNVLIRGHSRIQLYNGQHHFNEPFVTTAKLDKDNQTDIYSAVYRYPATGIGSVELNPDGTAYYWGKYRWKKI